MCIRDSTVSSFDTGKHTSEKKAPENLASCYDCQGVANGSSLNYSSNLYAMTEQSSLFFHGFVLGLMVEPVSYTHLDVYKRQVHAVICFLNQRCLRYLCR